MKKSVTLKYEGQQPETKEVPQQDVVKKVLLLRQGAQLLLARSHHSVFTPLQTLLLTSRSHGCHTTPTNVFLAE